MEERKGFRSEDYFVGQIVKNPEETMKDFCRIADQIYEVFTNGKAAGLKQYLIDVIGIEDGFAEKISRAYIGGISPQKINIHKYLVQKSWKEIIPKLSLQLDSGEIWPKNILAWEIVKFLRGEEYFSWDIVGVTGENYDNTILFENYPIAEDGNNIPIPLFSLNVIREGDIPYHIKRKARSILLALGDDVGLDLVKTFMEAGALFPPKKIVRQFVEVVKRGLSGEEVILTSCVCPDYNYRIKSDIGKTIYEYTFTGLGDGVGLVAKQVQRMIGCFDKFFKRHSIKYRVVMSIADFEANQDNCQRVGESYESFMGKCQSSLMQFEKSLPDVLIHSRLFKNEWAFGRWNDTLEYCRGELRKGNFGIIRETTGKDPKTTISFIAKDNANFYKRWHSDITDAKIQDIVVTQAAEYAATGMIMANDLKGTNFFQIAGDRPKMNVFNNFDSKHPTICAERVY